MPRRSVVRGLLHSWCSPWITVGVARWVRNVSKAWHVAFEALGLLFLSSACIAAFVAWQRGAESMALLRVVLDPARASVAFALLSLIVPAMFRGRKLQPDQVVVFPLVFCLLLVSLKIVSEGSRPPLTRFGEAARLDVIWIDPRFVALVGVIQMALLFGAWGVKRKC